MKTTLHIAVGPPDTSGGAALEAAAEVKPTIASLTAENVALKSRLSVYEAREKQQAADELLISEKMRSGLRRNQAIAVIKRQRDFAPMQKKRDEDKAEARARKEAKSK